jgi:hypothetical protein
MRAQASTASLARLHRSTRLSIFLLLVFALKLGAIVTCTAHDILDSAIDANGTSASAAGIGDAPDNGSNENPFDLGGSCEHCGCHQTVAIMPVVCLFPPLRAAGTATRLETAARHVLLPKELRPPIV